MKKAIVILSCVGLLVVLGVVLQPKAQNSRKENSDTITVRLTGTPGAAFAGEYVCDGRRVPISGVLPWNLTDSNILSLEIRKTKNEDTLTLFASGGDSSVYASSASDSKGIRLDLTNDWSVQMVR